MLNLPFPFVTFYDKNQESRDKNILIFYFYTIKKKLINFLLARDLIYKYIYDIHFLFCYC